MILDQGSHLAGSTYPVIVKKFGGTSVGTVARIQRVAQLALAAQRAGQGVVVVVSAMSGETNRLLGLATEVAAVSDRRERDALIASGEQVTAALTAIAINAGGGKARSFLGHQLRVLTDGAFGDARVSMVETLKLRACLERGEIPVIAGFQGVDDAGNITTLGRGGSDTTAVAVAAALNATSCDIYTDVDGVYTADPNVCANARKLARVPYQQMLTLATLGAKVLHDRSVEMAMEHRVPVHVRSSFADTPGTWITEDGGTGEGVAVGGIACDRNLAHVQLAATASRADMERMLVRLGASGIRATGIFAELDTPSFTLRAADAAEAREILQAADLPLSAIEDTARVSIVGSRLTDDPAFRERAVKLVEDCGIRVEKISVTSTVVSLLMTRAHADRATRALHDGLDVGMSPEHATPLRLRYGRELGD